MLSFPRAEILQYLEDRKISYRSDVSNKSEEFTRNRIRILVMPLLRERFNPQVAEALLRLAEQARAVDAYLNQTSERLLESLVISHDDHQIVLHAQLLARKPRVLQAQVVRHALTRLGLGEQEMTHGHFEALINLAAGREGSKMLDLPGDVRASRRYARLVFERTSGHSADPRLADEMRVSTNGTTLLPNFSLELAADIFPADEETIAAHIRQQADRGQVAYEEWLDADRVHLPLVARSRRPGDRFLPLGMTGMKKLSDFFIDEKIDAVLRDRSVVLCDQLGPVWLVPFRIDHRVRLSRATRRILRLRARRMEKSQHP
ncbi:MAG: hypothetical protein AMXMBFR13_45740 [Phycisphaerae bacterium]